MSIPKRTQDLVNSCPVRKRAGESLPLQLAHIDLFEAPATHAPRRIPFHLDQFRETKGVRSNIIHWSEEEKQKREGKEHRTTHQARGKRHRRMNNDDTIVDAAHQQRIVGCLGAATLRWAVFCIFESINLHSICTAKSAPVFFLRLCSDQYECSAV